MAVKGRIQKFEGGIVPHETEFGPNIVAFSHPKAKCRPVRAALRLAKNFEDQWPCGRLTHLYYQGGGYGLMQRARTPILGT
jgi:hypothetical protein